MNNSIHQHSFYGMGTEISIWLELADETIAKKLLLEAEGIFTTAEQSLSRFNPQSELSRLNSRPNEWVPLSPHLWRIINKAFTLAAETNGLFDPTILNALKTSGYTQDFKTLLQNKTEEKPLHPLSFTNESPFIPHPSPPPSYTNDYTSASLNHPKQTIYLPEGVSLDLGGIAKGETAEMVVNFLNKYGPSLVDAGGDLSAGQPPTGEAGWLVGVAIPGHQTDESLAHLWLKNGTLATSGIDYRRWSNNGRLAHHLIDPRTQQPANTDLLTVTIFSPTAAHAEAWATATLVAGLDAGYETATLHNLPALFIDQHETITVTPSMVAYFYN